jgi:hypothetical protein
VFVDVARLREDAVTLAVGSLNDGFGDHSKIFFVDPRDRRGY